MNKLKDRQLDKWVDKQMNKLKDIQLNKWIDK